MNEDEQVLPEFKGSIILSVLDKALLEIEQGKFEQFEEEECDVEEKDRDNLPAAENEMKPNPTSRTDAKEANEGGLMESLGKSISTTAVRHGSKIWTAGIRHSHYFCLCC